MPPAPTTYSPPEYQRVVGRLNSYQRAVVNKMREQGTRPVQVVAAAGSGKTATLIAGIAEIAHNQGISLGEVIVTTFTRKAMDELDARLKPVLPPGMRSQLRLGTWHGLAGRHLKNLQYAERPRHGWSPDRNLDIVGGKGGRDGLPRPEYIWGDIVGPSWREVRWLQGVYGMGLIDDSTSISPRDYALAVDVLSGKGWRATDEQAIREANEYYPLLQSGGSTDAVDTGYDRRSNESGNPRYAHGLLIEAWRRYERVKAALNAWDFRDSMDHYWRYGRESAKLLLVDEAQDNSFNQLDCARKIARRGGGRFFLIGDVRQSIFSWKGAEPEFMLNLGETDDAELLEIPTNYRSGRHIVDLGNAIAKDQSWSMGSAALAARTNAADSERDIVLGKAVLRVGHPYGGPESPVVDGYIRRMPTGSSVVHTASAVAQSIQQLLGQGVPHKDIAILNRTNGANVAYELACLEARIPVLCVGSKVSFFDRKEVADCMAWAALICHGGTGRDVVRALARPAKGASEAVVGRAVRDNGWEETAGTTVLKRLIDAPPGHGIGREKNRKALTVMQNILQELQDIWQQEQETPHGGWKTILPAIAEMYLRKDEKAEAEAEDTVTTDTDTGADLIKTWVTIASGFDGLPALRAFAARMAHEQVRYISADDMSADDRANFEADRASRVTISTIHRSKGLEWSYVFVELTKQVFPGNRSASSEDRMAEEQRLFYVAVTRAANVLSVCCSAVGPTGKPAGPSDFMDTVDAYLREHPEAAPAGEEPTDDRRVTGEEVGEPEPVRPPTREFKTEEFLSWIAQDDVLGACRVSGERGSGELNRLTLHNGGMATEFTVVAYQSEGDPQWWEIYINRADTPHVSSDDLMMWPALSPELVDALREAVVVAARVAASHGAASKPVDIVVPDPVVVQAVVAAATPEELNPQPAPEVLDPESGVLHYLIQGLRSGTFADVTPPDGWSWLTFADYLEGEGRETALALLQQLMAKTAPALGGTQRVQSDRVQASVEIPKPPRNSGPQPKAYIVTGRDPVTGKPTSQVPVPFGQPLTLLSGGFVIVRTEAGGDGTVSWDIYIVRSNNTLASVRSCTFPQIDGPEQWERCWANIPDTWSTDRLSQHFANAPLDIYRLARRLYEASGGGTLIELSQAMVGSQKLAIMPLTDLRRLLDHPASAALLDTTAQGVYKWLI